MFELRFTPEPLEELDSFALKACQADNFGNTGDWFGSFRGGIYAVRHRVHAIQRHYAEMHGWSIPPRILGDVEQHLADILFNIDSAMECLVFGLNALGFAIKPTEFLDVTDRRNLRKVNPGNIAGPNSLSGYGHIFVGLKKHWVANEQLIDFLVEQHDVSKHRSVAFKGGKMRDDPPPGYFDSLGIPDDPIDRALCRPMAEIILLPDPKMPAVERKPTHPSDHVLLEELVPKFQNFFNEALRLAKEDAMSNIRLKSTSVPVSTA